MQTFTERFLMYALGRTIDYRDMPAVRKIVREAAGDDYRFSSLVWQIVTSEPFQIEAGAGGPGGHGAERARSSAREEFGFAPGREVGQREESVMFITKKHLSRRTMLKGVGATIALPLLDAMSPAGSRLGENAPRDRRRSASRSSASRTAP